MTNSTFKVAHNGLFISGLERPNKHQARHAMECYVYQNNLDRAYKTHFFSIVEFKQSATKQVKTLSSKEVYSASY